MRASRKNKPRILAVFGSPRKYGISSTLHRHFLKPFEGSAIIKKVFAAEADVHHCTACGRCRSVRECIFKDGMERLYEEIEKADLIVISAPVYFSSLPGVLKILIDRCQMLWEQYSREDLPTGKRKGFFISVSGSDYKSVFIPSVTVIRHFFNSMRIRYVENEFLLFPDMENVSPRALPQSMIRQAYKMGTRYKSRILAKY